jgi:mRNA-degrading endonuclease RelE of RelBE toxin-antitoxin system
MAYAIVYSPEALDHLSAMGKTDQVMVTNEVDQQLTHEPKLETRKRKLLRPNSLAPWQLRLGDVRVFYSVQDEPDLTVTVKPIGKKIHNELWIGTERVQL